MLGRGHGYFSAHLHRASLAPGEHLVADAWPDAASPASALLRAGQRHPALLQPRYAPLRIIPACATGLCQSGPKACLTTRA